MPSLQKSDDRFGARIEILEGGSGFFKGIVDEPGQGTIPAYQFTNPRRLLRVNPDAPVKPSMVIRTLGGSVFIVGELGDAENIFKSFRLFETTGQYNWQKRTKTIDPVTQLPMDTGLLTERMIWGAYEPASQEVFDRQLHVEMENGRFITNAPIKLNDIVAGKRVTRVDAVLGVKLGVIG